MTQYLYMLLKMLNKINRYVQIGPMKLIVYAIVLSCIFCLGAISAYNNEVGIRRDFLLQQELNVEREQSKVPTLKLLLFTYLE